MSPVLKVLDELNKNKMRGKDLLADLWEITTSKVNRNFLSEQKHYIRGS